jgi:hypothetical protein
MRGGKRAGAGRRGLKTIACRLPAELHKTINAARGSQESFAAAALRIIAFRAKKLND